MWDRTDITATFWSLNAICIVLVAIRVYVRLTAEYRPWRELLVVFALIAQIFYSVTQIFTYYRFGLYTLLVPSLAPGEVTKEDWEGLWKLLFINQFVVGLGTIAYQAVLMLMYMDLCSRLVFPKIWMLIVINWAIMAVSAGLVLIYTFFGFCPGHHFSTIWKAPPGTCNNNAYLVARNVISDVNELLLYVIPIFIVCQLPNLSRIKKVSIGAMFSVGFVNIGLFAVNTMIFLSNIIYQNKLPSSETVWSGQPPALGFEQFCQGLFIPTGLMVICMPQLRVLGRWKLARRVVSSVTHSIGVGTSESRTTSNTLMDGRPAREQSMAESQVQAEKPPAVQQHIITVIDEEKGVQTVENPSRATSSSS